MHAHAGGRVARRRRVLLLVVPLAVVLLAGAGLGGTWLWAKTTLEQGYADWLAERRAEGYSFDNAEPRIDGFPLAVTAHLDRPAIAAPDGWRWQAPGLRGEADVTDPFAVRFSAPGTHVVTLPRGATLTLEAEAADGRLRLSPDEAARTGALHLRRTRLRGLPVGPVAARTLDFVLGPRRVPDGAPRELDFRAAATDLALPPDLDTPFGRRISEVALAGTVLGPLPRRAGPAELHAWREAGGAIEFARLRLAWPPLTLTGDGRLRLDEKLRPLGKLTVRVEGLAPALDRLAAAGLIEAEAARYAKLAVAALQERDEATGRTVVHLPLSFRQGRLYLGPVPLLRLSPVLSDRTSRPGALRRRPDASAAPG